MKYVSPISDNTIIKTEYAISVNNYDFDILKKFHYRVNVISDSIFFITSITVPNIIIIFIAIFTIATIFIFILDMQLVIINYIKNKIFVLLHLFILLLNIYI